MKRATTALLCIAVLGACLEKQGTGGGDVNEARNALPSADYLKIDVPASQGKDLGTLSGAYVLTRGVTTIVNGGAAAILILARTITLFPPSSIQDGTLIWGPWDGNALQPSQYRMTATLQSNGDWTWTFEGRRKADGSSAPFRAFLTGIATPGHPGRGSGSFTIDFSVAEALDPVGNAGQGPLAVAYDLESEPKTLTVNWDNVVNLPQGATPESVEYRYSEDAHGAGDFQFTAFGDTPDPGPLAETIEMRSRWNATGA